LALFSPPAAITKTQRTLSIADSLHRGTPRYKQEMNYDPAIALRSLSAPVLFLFGEGDKLVPVSACGT